MNWKVFSSTRSDILDIIKADITLPKGMVMFEDPPGHTMHRGLMSRVFTPKRMAELEDQVRQFCVRCLDPLVGSDGFDIIAELGTMLPMRVIGMLLGIPEQDQVSVRNKTDGNLRTQPGKPMVIVEEEVASGAMFADYIEWRAKHPSDDLMTVLLNAEFEDADGRRGHSRARRSSRTRRSWPERGTRQPGASSDGWPRCWRSTLTNVAPSWKTEPLSRASSTRPCASSRRATPPPAMSPRTSSTTGPPFPPEVRSCCRWHRPIAIHAASRIRIVFDIYRKDIQHMTFGYGLHFCLGSHLARLEGRVALDELLNRWPQWDVDYSDIKLAPTSTVRGWERMPIILR